MILNSLRELYEKWSPHILILLFIMYGVLTVVLIVFGIVGADSRCPACLVYEKFDDFWGYLDHSDYI